MMSNEATANVDSAGDELQLEASYDGAGTSSIAVDEHSERSPSYTAVDGRPFPATSDDGPAHNMSLPEQSAEIKPKKAEELIQDLQKWEGECQKDPPERLVSGD